MKWRSELARALGALGLLALSGCGRSPLPEVCADGFTLDTLGICVCENSAVCPTGFACVQGTCRCLGDECCPEGHHLRPASADEAEACVCQSDACCPENTRYDPTRDECVCTNDGCCPAGYTFDAAAEACVCQSDVCCPEGFRYLAEADLCECASDDCCPEATRYDEIGRGCTCAEDACCPESHVYSANVRACVCVGQGCCPAGFEQRPDGSCACLDDSACPSGLSCDRAENRCVCRSDAGCPASSFCNRHGFCQSREGCAGNDDCPAGTFCALEAARCLPDGACASDLHCPLGARCIGSVCAPGCDDTGDCYPGRVCASGRCEEGRCDDSSYCALASFCDAASQSCGPRDPEHCRSCDQGCSQGPCLVRIIEGNEGFTFCGVPCGDDLDCPGQMACGRSYQFCDAGFGGCPGDLQCRSIETLNEGLLDLCVDPADGRPAVIARYCTPLGGRCI